MREAPKHCRRSMLSCRRRTGLGINERMGISFFPAQGTDSHSRWTQKLAKRCHRRQLAVKQQPCPPDVSSAPRCCPAAASVPAAHPAAPEPAGRQEVRLDSILSSVTVPCSGLHYPWKSAPRRRGWPRKPESSAWPAHACPMWVPAVLVDTEARCLRSSGRRQELVAAALGGPLDGLASTLVQGC